MTSLETAIKAVPAGRYIVAVSGGVDSMVLLDCLRKRPELRIIVAHVNHGIRVDAALDMRLVEAFCRSHNITYAAQVLHLGGQASEHEARTARYKFLRKCLNKHDANAIITAHHQDDLIETVLINLLRGTGWRGLAPFKDNPTMLRPLVSIPKSMLRQYAADNAISYREDSTNSDQRYLRNYVRITVIPMIAAVNPFWKNELLQLIRKQQALRRTIEDELGMLVTSHISHNGRAAVSLRYIWCMLPHAEGYELFQAMCRTVLGHSLVEEQAKSALIFAKVAKPHKSMPLNNSWQLRVTSRQLIVEPRALMVQ